MDRLLDILLLQAGYNSAVVCVGAALLGAGGGIVGSFVLLRKRSLVSDAISHATLPGVVAAYIVGVTLLGVGRSLPLLLVGAALGAWLGILAVTWITERTRLPEDAAIGTVLSTFYGLGLVLLSWVQTMRAGGQAGLEKFLLGNTAGMLRSEAELITVAALLVTGVALAFFKELRLVAFDAEFARAKGWSVARLDLLLMALLLAIVVIGLTVVGLVLVIAIVIVPAVAARFWTERLGAMVAIAAAIGAAGGYVGAALSASAPRLPTGGVIVLTLAALFGLSLLFAPARGVLAGALRRLRFRLALQERQALLRLAAGRRPTGRLTRWRLMHGGLVAADGTPTPRGLEQARAAAREQALWELYLHEAPHEAASLRGFGLRAIAEALPSDTVRRLERRLASEAHP